MTDQGYHAIQKFNGDYRYDEIIILKKESSIKNFDELIYTLLCDYEGDFHEQAILKYLGEKGIIRELKSGNTHSLLSYIKNDPQIVRVDEGGIVHLESR